MNNTDQIIDTLESYGVSLDATFIPAKTFQDDEWRSKSINHNVVLIRGNARIETPYSQGIAHHPHYETGNNSVDHYQAMELSIQDGKAHRPGRSRWAAKKLPSPSIVDVLHSLLMDSYADCASFEGFCADYAYDTDSIKARESFEACRQTKLELLGMFTTKELDELAELYEDY